MVQAKGYPSDLVQKEMNKIKFSGDWDKSNKRTSKGVSLVITVHPLLKDFGNIIHKKLYLLYGPRSSKSFYAWTHDNFP